MTVVLPMWEITDERTTYEVLARTQATEYGIAYGGRPLWQRNSHSTQRTGKPFTRGRGVGSSGR
jgi:hypothetical protein